MFSLIPLVISIGMGLLARLFAPKPQGGPQAPTQFQIPDALNGVKVNYLCGTYLVTPNICFYGGYRVVTKHHKNKPSTQTAYLSHMDVLCLGPVDQLLQIYADDASVSPYAVYGDITAGSDVISNVADTSGIDVGMIISAAGIPLNATVKAKGASTLTISAAATNSGTHKALTFFSSGNTNAVLYQGVLDRGTDDTTTISTSIGRIQFYWGTSTQTTDGYLRRKGLPTSSNFPNICRAEFQDCKLNAGFQLQRLNFVLKRLPVTPLSGAVEVGNGINPAHVLWDVLTNKFAGSQFDASDLDMDAFNAMAATFETEGVGINVLYGGKSMQDILKDFIAEFDCVMRISDGKLSPLLIRDDVDAGTIPTLNEDNADDLVRRRDPGGNAPNDLVFLYANADRMWRQDPVEIFNLGSSTTLNKRLAQQITFNLVTDVASASAIAARKSRHLSTPADTITAKANPGVAETLEIGDALVFSSERLHVNSMICRVVDRMETSARGVQVSLQEDVFRLVDADFSSDDGTVPRIAGLAKPQRQRIVEIPYDVVGDNLALLLLFSRGSESANGVTIFESIDDVEYNQLDQVGGYAAVGVLAEDYPNTPKIDRTVGIVFDADNSDVLEVPTQSEDGFLLHQQLAVIGDEIIAIKSLTPIDGGSTDGGRWRIDGVIRGLADTDAAAHAAGSVIYLVPADTQDAIIGDSMIRVGNSIYLKATPYNQSAAMNLTDVDAAGPYTVAGRASKPLPVANLQANGAFVNPTYSTDIHVTWDYRVRGQGAGVSSPNAGVLFASTPHEGLFTVDVVVGASIVRTVELNTDDTAVTGWTYTQAMNLSDNGSLAAGVQIRVRNRISNFYSIARAITVRQA